MRNSKKWIWFLIGAVLLIAAAPKIRSIFLSEDRGRAQIPTQRAQPVTVYIVRPQRLTNAITVSGTVLPNEAIAVRSEIAGKIRQIAFHEGQAVSKGQLLVKIDDTELQAQLRKVEYQKSLAEKKEYRQRLLLQKEAISEQEYDIVRTELQTLEAEIALLKAQIAKTEIRAPFDGVIGLRNVSIGSYITPSDVLTTLQDIDTMKVEFAIPEKYHRMVKPGNLVYFTVEGLEKEFKATIYAIDPHIDPESRSLQIRARLPNPSGTLLPGAFAQVRVILENIPSAIMVPSEAIVPTAEGMTVYLYRSGKAVAQPITIGIRTDRAVQILSGIQPGDTVITTGLLQIRSGSDVTIAAISHLEDQRNGIDNN